MVLRSWIIEIG
ncbi:hypothetical protein LINPERPRIM_LOCUS22749 [Linum perenne]